MAKTWSLPERPSVAITGASLASADAATRAIRDAEKALDPIDVLVNNAGLTGKGKTLAWLQRILTEARRLGHRPQHHRPPATCGAQLVKRRDVLRSLVGVASLSGVASAETQGKPALSPAAVEELMRAHGLDPLPGEPAQVRALLLSTRLRSIPDPRIEPAIRLDPELD